MLAQGTLLNHRYQLKRLFSESGGMGLIYQAVDQNLGNTVVVKQMRCTEKYLRTEYPGWPDDSYATKSQELSEAFVREARLLSGLRHNALPRAIDYFFVEDVGQCFVMEFIPGKDLREMLEEREQLRQGAFSLDQVMEWADQLLDVLHYLHTHQPPIIHRDLKPSNLKLMPSGQIILLDFGLAKGAVEGMSGPIKSTVGHTPHYAALEQIHGKGTDARSDLYSLAVTLHQMLTLRMPPDAVERASETFSSQPDPLVPIHELNSQVPAAVSQAILKAASLNPNERPATAAAMRQELKQARRPLNAAMFASPMMMAAPAAVPQPATVSEQNINTVVNANEAPSPTVQFAQPQMTPEVIAQLYELHPYAEELGNNVKLEMIALPGGVFTIGAPKGQGSDDERPQFQVTVSPFFIGRYPITQAQYEAVMGTKPSLFDGRDHPVECVSWHDASEFCQKLSQLTGRAYRLPTETEWEFACRAGTETKFSFGDKDAQLDQYAWYDRNAMESTHPVGQKRPNEWGLYDLYGNVWEWCLDWYAADAYHSNEDIDPKGPPSGNTKVIRGGAWNFPGEECRSANRHHFHPITGFDSIGFRVVVSLAPVPSQEPQPE